MLKAKKKLARALNIPNTKCNFLEQFLITMIMHPKIIPEKNKKNTRQIGGILLFLNRKLEIKMQTKV